MDEHGQIGPEKPNYATDLEDLAGELRVGNVVYLRFANRGTRFPTIVMPIGALTIYGDEAPDGTAELGGDVVAHYHLVQVEGRGAYWFDLRLRKHASYVNNKLGIKNETDAESIAGFLDDLGAALYPGSHERVVGRYKRTIKTHQRGDVNIIELDTEAP